jgi:N-acetylglutamate synthase-like GNAT family acetyltransferase
MAIRPANPYDADAICRLLNAYNLNKSDCATMIDNDDLRVLTQDSDIVGILTMTDGVDHLEVDRLVVAASPKADAFAKIMVMFAEQEARERGHDQVRLRVTEPVTAYRSLGYRHARGKKASDGHVLMTKIVV